MGIRLENTMNNTDTRDPQAAASAASVSLTPEAQAKALAFLAEEEEPQGKVLRVGVNSGGCSGFSYAVSIDVKKADDAVVAYAGFEAVVDPVSLQFLSGTVVGYEDTVGRAGFTFENPQAASSCGCGTSFDVDV